MRDEMGRGRKACAPIGHMRNLHGAAAAAAAVGVGLSGGAAVEADDVGVLRTAISRSGGGMGRKAYRGKLGQELHFCLGVAERFPEELVELAL